MASGPITSWQIDGNKMKTVTNFKSTKMTLNLIKSLLVSRFSRVRLRVTPQTAAQQAAQSLGFSRQEYWSGLPFPSPMHEK